VLKDALAQSLSKLPIRGALPKDTLLGGLSNIQLETLRLMSQGLSNAEIAKRRSVTEKAVELAIARLAKSLGIQKDSSRNQRVHIANVYFRAIGQNKK
jgi:DNA-binding NarL/FixJ family response regulator